MTIDELAQAIQQEFLTTKKEIREEFVKIDERFNKIDERFDEVDERFNKIDERFGKVDGDINYIHGHLALIERKLDKKADVETVNLLRDRVSKLEVKMK